MTENYFEILGVKHLASQQEIRKSYYKRALLFHPDKNQDEKAIEKMRLLNRAYNTLKHSNTQNESDRNNRINYSWHSITSFQQELEKQLDKLRIILEDIIDLLTDGNFKQHDLLGKKQLIESQKISKFKNFVIKIFSFGFYDKNKRLESKIKKIQNELDKVINDQKIIEQKYKNNKIEKEKLNIELYKLKAKLKASQCENNLIQKINATDSNYCKENESRQTYNNSY